MALSTASLANISDVIPDGLTELGTYTPKGGTPITGVTLEWRPLSRSSPLYGVVSLDNAERECVLRNNQLNGNTPRDGDTITDASSTVYGITGAVVRLAGARHHCACTKHRG